MMKSLMILGRQPELGIAELESLYGSTAVQPVGDQATLLDIEPSLVTFDRLGGTVKFCKVLTVLDKTDWRDIEKYLVQVSPDHAQQVPEGKMHIGLSAYGFKVSPSQLTAIGLSLKKAIKKTGRSIRLVPNSDADLSSAQVYHNHLTGERGWELVFVRDDNKTIIAQTVRVQDIDAYTHRDRERPKRDTRVGMLPPKLGQTLINLAAGLLPLHEVTPLADGQLPPLHLDQTVLDPFCGTGVVLQEAALMGYGVYGTDLESRMIDYSKENLEWFSRVFHTEVRTIALEAGDATHHQWTEKFDIVASETYLGRPFTSPPTSEILAQTVTECNLIIKKFLRNISVQTKPGTRLCLAIPAWAIGGGAFRHLPLIDQMEEMGYNRVSFEHVGASDLLYYREDQIVARELLVITRK